MEEISEHLESLHPATTSEEQRRCLLTLKQTFSQDPGKRL